MSFFGLNEIDLSFVNRSPRLYFYFDIEYSTLESLFFGLFLTASWIYHFLKMFGSDASYITLINSVHSFTWVMRALPSIITIQSLCDGFRTVLHLFHFQPRLLPLGLHDFLDFVPIFYDKFPGCSTFLSDLYFLQFYYFLLLKSSLTAISLYLSLPFSPRMPPYPLHIFPFLLPSLLLFSAF